MGRRIDLAVIFKILKIYYIRGNESHKTCQGHVQVTFQPKLKKKKETTFGIYGAPRHDMQTKIYIVVYIVLVNCGRNELTRSLVLI